MKKQEESEALREAHRQEARQRENVTRQRQEAKVPLVTLAAVACHHQSLQLSHVCALLEHRQCWSAQSLRSYKHRLLAKLAVHQHPLEPLDVQHCLQDVSDAC